MQYQSEEVLKFVPRTKCYEVLSLYPKACEAKPEVSSKALNTEDLIVVRDDFAKEGRVAATGGNFARAANGEGMHIAGGGSVPSRVPGHVGVARVEERLVPRLHLGDERRLLRVRARGRAELETTSCEHNKRTQIARSNVRQSRCRPERKV